MRGRDVVEFLGLWEVLHNPDFKRIDFDTFKEEAGTNAFVFSIKNWTDELGAIGLFTKSGRYGGGIYAHIDIAFELASCRRLAQKDLVNFMNRISICIIKWRKKAFRMFPRFCMSGKVIIQC